MSASFDCASLSGAHQPMAYCCTVQMSYVSYRLVIQWASLYLASDRRALSDYVRLLSSCCYFAARFIGSSFIFFFVNSRCACVYYAYVMHGLYCFMHNLSRSCCRVFGSQYACERRPKLLRSGKNGIFLFGGIFFLLLFVGFGITHGIACYAHTLSVFYRLLLDKRIVWFGQQGTGASVAYNVLHGVCVPCVHILFYAYARFISIATNRSPTSIITFCGSLLVHTYSTLFMEVHIGEKRATLVHADDESELVLMNMLELMLLL